MASGSSRTPLVVLALLFVAAFGLRVPSFWTGYASPHEAQAWAEGQRVAAGHGLYTQTQSHAPPLVAWFYAANVALFGDAALWAIRLIGCLWLFVAAFLFNQALASYRFARDGTWLPGFLFLLAFATPWHEQAFVAEEMLSLPLLGCFLLVLAFGADEHPRPIWLFWAGLLGSVCVGLMFLAVFVFAALALGAAMIGRLRPPGFVTLLGGFAVGVALIGLGLHFTGAVAAFYDQTFLFALDAFTLPNLSGSNGAWPETAAAWGGLLLVASVGFLLLRQGIARAAIRQRKIETLMLLWGFFAAGAMLLGGFASLRHGHLLMPPLLFYAVWFVQLRLRGRWLPLALGAMLAYPTLTFATFLAVCTPANFAVAKALAPGVLPQGWLLGLHHRLHPAPGQQALAKHLHDRGATGMWVAGFQPQLYLQLGLPCDVPFAQYALVHHKFTWLDHNLRLRGRLLSHEWTMAEVYRALQANPPQFVLDPLGTFAEIRNRMPLLLGHYWHTTVGGMVVWHSAAAAQP